jgi:hypothetical protein
MQKRPEQHIAADAGKAVQVGYPGSRWSGHGYPCGVNYRLRSVPAAIGWPQRYDSTVIRFFPSG